jgi:hypothetical protein
MRFRKNKYLYIYIYIHTYTYILHDVHSLIMASKNGPNM